MQAVLASEFCEMLIMTPSLKISQPKEPIYNLQKKYLDLYRNKYNYAPIPVEGKYKLEPVTERAWETWVSSLHV
jgi:hypothetical protein